LTPLVIEAVGAAATYRAAIRYCGAECASAARRGSLRRAARAYQRTERGRRLHADRQARYRARL